MIKIIVLKYYAVNQSHSTGSSQLPRKNCEILNLHWVVFTVSLAVDKTLQKQTASIQLSEIFPTDFKLYFSIYFVPSSIEALQKIKIIIK